MTRLSIALLCAACLPAAFAANPAPAAAPAEAPKPPPQWARTVPVSVLVGADVVAGVSGFVAPASLVLAVTEPAKLPAGLITGSEGRECVFEAEGFANLASERVRMTVKLLRCFDADGREVLTRPVRGFAVDADARAGIKGPLVWAQAARDLLLMGVGTQARQNFLVRTAKSALGKASLGLTDSLMESDDDKRPRPEADAVRELRSSETLMPTIAIEPGKTFGVVLHGTP
jgi:hypothetical protein